MRIFWCLKREAEATVSGAYPNAQGWIEQRIVQMQRPSVDRRSREIKKTKTWGKVRHIRSLPLSSRSSSYSYLYFIVPPFSTTRWKADDVCGGVILPLCSLIRRRFSHPSFLSAVPTPFGHGFTYTSIQPSVLSRLFLLPPSRFRSPLTPAAECTCGLHCLILCSAVQAFCSAYASPEILPLRGFE